MGRNAGVECYEDVLSCIDAHVLKQVYPVGDGRLAEWTGGRMRPFYVVDKSPCTHGSWHVLDNNYHQTNRLRHCVS